MYDGLRGWFEKNCDLAVSGHSARQRRPLARAEFTRCDKEIWVHRWLRSVKLPEYVEKLAVEIYTKDTGFLINNASTALLTFNGQWGWLDGGGSFAHTGLMGMDEVVSMLLADKGISALWDQAQEFACRVAALVHAEDHAVCLEVCPQTLEVRQNARVHMHIFLRSSSRMQLKHSAAVCFRGARPQSATIVAGMPLTRRASCWSGFFYCLAAKLGQLYCMGTRRPFKDFLVNAAWVLNLLQAGKLSLTQARSYILQCCSGAARHLQLLDVLQVEADKLQIRDAVRAAKQALGLNLRQFVEIAQVQKWLQTFSTMQSRYQFLVLEGPSGVGKTQYALHVLGTRTLELNCAACLEPPLKEYKYGFHGGILFDEGSVAMVLRQRKLFQCAAAEVQLGCSATNAFTYSVFVHRTPLIVCSNTWSQQLACQSPEDAAWIAANTVHVMVREKLWCDVSQQP